MNTPIQQALAILDRMDDNITERGGDEDEHGRRDLALIRRAKDHLRKCLAHEKPAAASFVTDDGFKLFLSKDGHWTDGDLVFHATLWPVTDHGVMLAGRMIDTVDVTYSCGHIERHTVSAVTATGIPLLLRHIKAMACEACRTSAIKYRPGFVVIDDDQTPLACYLSSERWNGWSIPYFSREQLPAYIEWQMSVGYHSVEYQENIDAVVTMATPDESEAWAGEDIVVDGTTIHAYPVGAQCWIWDEVEAPKNG